MSANPSTPEELIMSVLVEGGLSSDDETTQQIAGKLANFFQIGMSRVEVTCRISEIEQALEQKNKMLYGSQIEDDIGNRNLIDPNILIIRLDQLRNMLKG
jgi:hypothetical protein